MNANIKITMLGGSGSGKTCFMLGMYAIMQAGVRGFNFAADPDVDLELSELWENIEDGQGQNRFPLGNSDVPKYYSFKFLYGLTKKIAQFNWIDYRGMALKDKSAEQDVQELKKHLRESSGIFLCISGEHLSSDKADKGIYAKQKNTLATRMLNFLTELAEETDHLPSKQLPPVVIVITKYDLCCDRDQDELIEDVKAMFTPLFVKDSGWFVALAPVTLGYELADNPTNGLIEPINIHLPVSFVVYQELGKIVENARGYRNQKQQEVHKYTGGKIRNWWNKGKINISQNDLQEANLTIEEIEKKMDLLSQDLIGSLPLFYNGKNIDLDEQED